MLCLGIETSCDETSLALVGDGKLLGHVLASQTDLHAIFGGVVPELASREHYRFIGPLFNELLDRCQIELTDLNYVAVARGPGLLGSLLVGVAFAKALALALNINILAINHLQAHILAAGLENTLHFPALALLVSGGHTNIYRINRLPNFEQLGRTIDDAAGEAFDKVGNILGFSYPAGRLFDQAASLGQPTINFTLPYLHNDNLDFSFSGLKTAATLSIKENLSSFVWEKPIKDPTQLPKDVLNFCASFNLAIAKTIKAKLERALDRNLTIEHLILAGGVAANSCLRQELTEIAKKRGLKLLIPSPLFCTDNGAMIAYAGFEFAKMGLVNSLEFKAIPRGQRIPNDYLFCNKQS
ncbi:MAG: tRNA (adenosine(37)-N6)-threonylcarbamoyltransferase complex transferase subunit TsaD [Desulfovibrionaceae bacterium]|nr:tRNA (adenosine(37)-N6)-threonylcarbamoyltransferase complex transferase subunit TsaD [Desulfovibrionaceae bacterium]